MRIAVVPIDNRPICYDLINDILSVDNSIELFMPSLEYLGGLTSSSNVEKIFEFIEKLDNIDYLIVSLDTIAYGGLITSRRCEDSFEIIKNRIEKFKEIASKKVKKILAFSSIMRISNNNINEEEKEYWSKYGKMIFDWSWNICMEVWRNRDIENYYRTDCHTSIPQDIYTSASIPNEILQDYLTTRKRNFKINKIYLNWAQEGFFDTLIFSKDDCAEFGLNVKEANLLQEEINSKNIKNVLIKTGADEIPLSLISRALTYENKIKIKPQFIELNSIDKISKYEDITINNCVLAQLSLAGVEVNQNNPDLIMLINNFKDEQGDLVLGDRVNKIDKTIEFPLTPYFIADVNNANGADCALIEQLFNQNLDNFYGYCGYNTSANTVGCVILSAIVKFRAVKNKTYNENTFKKLQLIRFLDDWAYQAITRKYVRESDPEFIWALNEKKDELNQNAQKICEFLKMNLPEIKYSLPWKRSFEIRIEI